MKTSKEDGAGRGRETTEKPGPKQHHAAGASARNNKGKVLRLRRRQEILTITGTSSTMAIQITARKEGYRKSISQQTPGHGGPPQKRQKFLRATRLRAA